MKRSGILHPELNEALSRLGHTDTFVVGDVGLPVPPQVRRIDLAVVLGVPSFVDVLDAILAEVEVEGAVIATEAEGRPAGQLLSERFAQAERVPHEGLKQLSGAARFVVRTGEASPYANVVLRCGVPF